MTPFEIVMLAIRSAAEASKLANLLVERAKRNAELTSEEEAQVDARHAEIMSQSHWQLPPS